MSAKQIFRAFVLCFGLAGLTGCASTPAMPPAMQEFLSFAKFKGDDIANPADEDDEQWISDAGIEARGDRPLESENDPFRFLMSNRARSIERNLGIGD